MQANRTLYLGGRATVNEERAGERLQCDPDTEPAITFVTGSLNVRYLRPTPAGVELVLRSRVTETHEKKAIVVTSVYADGVECVSGEVVAVRVPSRMMQR